MLVSLQIQGAPTELVSVLTAIGGISLPVDAPVLPLPVPHAALPAAETKQPRKNAAKQSASTSAPQEPVVDQVAQAEPTPAEEERTLVDEAVANPQPEQASEEPKGERLSLEKIRAVFNDKLAGHRDTIKGILTSYESKGLTEFYGKATPEQHVEFFNKISSL